MAYTYENLREKYPQFIYEDFKTKISNDKVKVEFNFKVPGLAEFKPRLSFPLDNLKIVNQPLSDFAKNLIFSIGLVELISYWKIACPPEVIIKAGSLNNEQIAWWKKLYFNGLGEFFYKNKINPDPENFMHIKTTGPDLNTYSDEFKTTGLNLIPIGGGKDSVVTIEHLQPLKADNVIFSLNPTEAAKDCTRVSNYPEEKRFVVSRTLDPEMLRLNSEGYLNGHTPFSALLAFVSYYVAYLIGANYIVLSNEASANAATVPGTKINHQYSKTSEFERAFQAYSKEYFSENIFYFSLLRPFAEIAIARSFSQYEQYFPYFKSCNVGSKQNIWCCNCSKCMFVYAVLAPFLDESTLVKIFGRNLWENPNLLNDWKMLLGAVKRKPFECVGTIEEVQFAAYLVINKKLENACVSDLPLLLKEVVKSAKKDELSELKWSKDKERLVSLAKENPLAVWHEDENLPEKFKDYVKDIVSEAK